MLPALLRSCLLAHVANVWLEIPAWDGVLQQRWRPNCGPSSAESAATGGVPACLRTELRGGGRGDLIAHIEVQTPSKLNKEQAELLKKFAQLRGDSPDKVLVHTHKDEGFFGRVRNAFR